MESAEGRILECLAMSAVAIDSPMTCSQICGVALTEARNGLDALARAGLIVWVPPERRWEITTRGRAVLQGETDADLDGGIAASP